MSDLPTTPEALADLMYRTHVPDLVDRLTYQMGSPDRAARLFWAAAELLETRYPIRVPDLRPYDVVWSRNGVDHQMVPGLPVTKCGFELPLLFSVNAPHGVPCPACFGDQ